MSFHVRLSNWTQRPEPLRGTERQKDRETKRGENDVAMKEVMKRGSRNTVSLWIFTEKVQYLRSYEEGRGTAWTKTEGDRGSGGVRGGTAALMAMLGQHFHCVYFTLTYSPKKTTSHERGRAENAS